MNSRILMTMGLAALLAACSLTPVASRVPGYITTPKGRLLQDAEGRCWRTAEWRPALAIPECDPDVVRAREEAAAAEAEQVAEEEKKKDEETQQVAAETQAEEAVAAVDADAVLASGGAAPSAERAAAAAALAASMGEPAVAPGAGRSRVFRDEVIFEPIVLNSDASFFFGDDHLTPEGRNAVIEIAGILKARRAQDLRITVSGHTDRIGSASANQALSRRRAAAVKAALVVEGLPATSIETKGMAATKPVTSREQCPDRLVKCELITCLRPDRRVEIQARGRLQSGTRQVPVEGRLLLPRPQRSADDEAVVCRAG